MNKKVYDSFRNLVNLLGEAKPLSLEEEKKYLFLAKEGNSEAVKQLVKHNLRLVFKMVSTSPYCNDNNIEDLFQEGIIALIASIKYYDYDQGAKFTSYAAQSIKYGIVRYMKANDTLSGMSEHTYKRKMMLASYLQDNEGKNLSIDELCKKFHTQKSFMIPMVNSTKDLIYIDNSVNKDIEDSLNELISDKTDFTEKIENKELTKLLKELIETSNLTDKELFALNELYLKDNAINTTIREVADKLNVKYQYIPMLLNKAFRKIRINKRTKYLSSYMANPKYSEKCLEILRDYSYKEDFKKTKSGSLLLVDKGKVVKNHN